jgi:hypothetical protein
LLAQDRWAALEADWAAVYHRDLPTDVFGPSPISWRKLEVFIEGLPPESRFFASFVDGVVPTWEREMLTALVELTHAQIRVAMMAAGVKKYKVPKPLTVERPWAESLRDMEGSSSLPNGGHDTAELMEALRATGAEVVIDEEGGGE